MFSVTNLIGRLFALPAGAVMGRSASYLCYSQNGCQLIEMVKNMIPSLSQTLYKGNCGRLGVIGGCQEYTGAPYFAGISVLKVGADLSHVFCTEGAATVIKSYSPELIVHPVLDRTSAVDEVEEWLPRLHSLIVGPGLGRDSTILGSTNGIIEKAMSLNMPLVIDADGVFLLSQDPTVIQGYKKAILTPNAVEFNRLYEKVIGSKPTAADPCDEVVELAKALGYVTIVRKGREDIISNGNEVLICDADGSPRRCGGQGDLLSGSMGVFTYWAHKTAEKSNSCELLQKVGPTLCAAYAACLLTRECSRRAFNKHRRSMTTSDMIEEIQQAFETLYC